MAEGSEVFHSFQEQYPILWDAYRKLEQAAEIQGPLDYKTQQLLNVAVCVAQGSERGLRAQIQGALNARASADEIYHAIGLCLPQVGFPGTLNAYAAALRFLQGEAQPGAAPDAARAAPATGAAPKPTLAEGGWARPREDGMFIKKGQLSHVVRFDIGKQSGIRLVYLKDPTSGQEEKFLRDEIEPVAAPDGESAAPGVEAPTAAPPAAARDLAEGDWVIVRRGGLILKEGERGQVVKKEQLLGSSFLHVLKPGFDDPEKFMLRDLERAS